MNNERYTVLTTRQNTTQNNTIQAQHSKTQYEVQYCTQYNQCIRKRYHTPWGRFSKLDRSLHNEEGPCQHLKARFQKVLDDVALTFQRRPFRKKILLRSNQSFENRFRGCGATYTPSPPLDTPLGSNGTLVCHDPCCIRRPGLHRIHTNSYTREMPDVICRSSERQDAVIFSQMI